MKRIRVNIRFAAALLVLCGLLSGCGQAAEPCCVSGCACSAAQDFLSFPEDKLMRECIRLRKGHMQVWINREDADAERFFDILRSFEPVSTSDVSGLLGMGCDDYGVQINLYDDYRRFTFSDSGIIMDGTLFEGKEGCLSELVEIFESHDKVDMSADQIEPNDSAN